MIALLVVAILVLLIIVHELGHFIAAKLSRVRVDEFGIGYPPRAFLLGTCGGTEYTLNWILFGGFVRLFGDEGDDERGRGSFAGATRGKQALILAAGVCMNLFTGWLLFTIALNQGIPRPVDTSGPGVQLLIADVVPGSPADAAQLHPGDAIVAMTDDAGASPSPLSPEGISAFVAGRGGRHISIAYERGGIDSIANAIPANAVIPNEAGRPGLGIGLVFVSSNPLPWSDAAVEAFSEMGNAFLRVAESIGSMIGEAVRGSLDLSGVVGPVGLVSVVGAAAKTGIAQVLALAGFISVNLAVINLLPIPALDGGRLLIVFVETIRRKPVSKIAVHMLNTIGILAILALMVVVTYHDIAHLVA